MLPLNWWKLYPQRIHGGKAHEPAPGDTPNPELAVGRSVRLVAKPECPRKILAVEWHWIRRQYAYIIETSAPDSFRPYWFEKQLLLIEQTAAPEECHH